MRFMKLITYNQALMWNRLEQIILVCAAAAIVAAVEVSTLPVSLQDIVNGAPPENIRFPIFSMITSFASQIWCLKCWMDMFLKSEPHLNCWAWEDKVI